MFAMLLIFGIYLLLSAPGYIMTWLGERRSDEDLVARGQSWKGCGMLLTIPAVGLAIFVIFKVNMRNAGL